MSRELLQSIHAIVSVARNSERPCTYSEQDGLPIDIFEIVRRDCILVRNVHIQ